MKIRVRSCDLCVCVLSVRSKLYPAHSLNVSSLYLKLGRLYMGLERHSAGVSALKKVRATSRFLSPLPVRALSASAPAVTPASVCRPWPSWRWLTARITPTWRSCGRRWAAASWRNEPLLMGNRTEGTFCYHLTESVHTFTEKREKMYMYSLYTSILNADLKSVADTFVAGLHFMFMLTVLKKKRKRKDDNVQNDFESFWL